jgi:hypothetical protein
METLKTVNGNNEVVPVEMEGMTDDLRALVALRKKEGALSRRVDSALEPILARTKATGDAGRLIAIGHFLGCIGSFSGRFFYEAAAPIEAARRTRRAKTKRSVSARSRK